MTTIAVANTKGGVSKTTSAIWLAACAFYDGNYVRVVDADPQGTATSWLAQTDVEDLTSGGVELMVANMATLANLPANGVNIVDTPPGDPAVIDRAVRNADFVLVPAAPSLAEVERVMDTIDITRGRVPAAVLLTQVNSQAVLYRQIADYLEEQDVLVFPTAIPRRESFRQAFGTWPANEYKALFGYDNVYKQISEAIQ